MPSSLLGPYIGCTLEKVSISSRKFVTTSVLVSVRVRDKLIYILQNSYIDKL
jgi:hypothetical protein